MPFKQCFRFSKHPLWIYQAQNCEQQAIIDNGQIWFVMSCSVTFYISECVVGSWGILDTKLHQKAFDQIRLSNNLNTCLRSIRIEAKTSRLSLIEKNPEYSNCFCIHLPWSIYEDNIHLYSCDIKCIDHTYGYEWWKIPVWWERWWCCVQRTRYKRFFLDKKIKTYWILSEGHEEP